MLPATPDEVFDAYTDAEKQKIWFTILDERPGVVEIEVDLRVGGARPRCGDRTADTLFRETQTFLEIDRPHRLVTESTGSSPGRHDDDHARRDRPSRRTATAARS